MGSFDPIAYYFAKKALKAAIPKLSLLLIDIDKDWNGKRIRNIGAPLTDNDVPRARAEDILSGVFDPGRIPNLNAGKITSGIFDIARIPDLDASKIVSGTLDPERIPNLLRAKISDFWDAPFWPNIPDKPSAFPPDAHAHGRSEVFDFWSSPFWPNIPDKPATFVDADGLLQVLRDFEVFWIMNHWMTDILEWGTHLDGRVSWGDREVCTLEFAEPYSSGSIAHTWKYSFGFSGRVSWDAKRYFGCHVLIGENTNQRIFIVSGLPSETEPHIGFKVINNALYGTVADGAGESTLLLATIPREYEAKLEAILTPGSECRFYINGEDKGALTTHLPSGGMDAAEIFHAKISNTQAEYKWLDIFEVRVLQLGLPPSPCPSGEQIVNGGFEKGDFTGWTRDPIDPNHWEVLTSDARGGAPPEGSYLAQFKALETDPSGPIGCPRATGTLQQNFATPIPYECFVATSIFQVKTKWDTDLCNPISPEVWKVEVLYTDDTSTTVDLTGDPRDEWVTHDLKAVLEAGKTVKGIKFTATVDRCGGPDIGLTEVTIDACTLVP